LATAGRNAVILVGLGANLDSPRYGPPRRTLEAALARLEARGIRVAACSRFYRSAPVPASDQPWYVNAVAEVETPLAPGDLLKALLAVEVEFGRVRSVANAARVLDLDLLAYGDAVTAEDAVPALPHPRLAGRAFVLYPLAEIAPDWRHPATGAPVSSLIGALPADQVAHPLARD
jgi:2-amino-4-hydroxy-6-hydroxymethyldihydropteridine diphosphokinase